MAKPKSLFQAITASLGTTNFKRGWPHQTFHVPGSVRRLQELTQIPELRSIETLLAPFPSNFVVRAWAPRPYGSEYNTELSPKRALAHYQKDYTLYLHQLEGAIPALVPILRRFERDLGVPAGCASAVAFASRGPGGASEHIDPFCVFNFQLIGTKRWELATNTYCPNPRFVSPEGAELFGCVKEFPPMPTVEYRYAAKPGSVVFLPHGIWHRTETDDESLAVAFLVDPKAWGNVVTDYLSKRLSHHPSERAMAGIAGVPSRRALQTRLRATTKIIARELANLDQAQFANEILPDYRWFTRTNVRTSLATSDRGRILLTLQRGKEQETVRVNAQLASVTTFVAAQRRAFRQIDAIAEMHTIPYHLVAEYLRRLVSAGVLAETRGRPRA